MIVVGQCGWVKRIPPDKTDPWTVGKSFTRKADRHKLKWNECLNRRCVFSKLRMKEGRNNGLGRWRSSEGDFTFLWLSIICSGTSFDIRGFAHWFEITEVLELQRFKHLKKGLRGLKVAVGKILYVITWFTVLCHASLRWHDIIEIKFYRKAPETGVSVDAKGLLSSWGCEFHHGS